VQVSVQNQFEFLVKQDFYQTVICSKSIYTTYDVLLENIRIISALNADTTEYKYYVGVYMNHIPTYKTR